MTKLRYLLFISLLTIITISGYCVLSYSNFITQLPLALLTIINCAIIIQYIGGSFIITLGKYKEPESFSQRFLVLITVQLLIVFTVILIIWYTNNELLKPFLIQYISNFVILMVCQSILLVRLGKSLENKS